MKSLCQDHTHSKWHSRIRTPSWLRLEAMVLLTGLHHPPVGSEPVDDTHYMRLRERLMHKCVNKGSHFQGHRPLTPVTRGNKREGGLCLSLSLRAAGLKAEDGAGNPGKCSLRKHHPLIKPLERGLCWPVLWGCRNLSWLDREEQGTLEVRVIIPCPAERSPHAMLVRTCQ